MREKEIMKTLIKITLAVLLIASVGCSKDENSSEPVAFSELSGVWEVTSYSYEGTTSYRAINNNDAWNTSYNAQAWLLDFELIFNEDPNDYSVLGTHKIDYYFTNEDGNEYYYEGDITKNEIGTYVRNSNHNISFTNGSDINHGTIVTLNENTLEINVSMSSSEVNSENILVTHIRNETYVYNRVN